MANLLQVNESVANLFLPEFVKGSIIKNNCVVNDKQCKNVKSNSLHQVSRDIHEENILCSSNLGKIHKKCDLCNMLTANDERETEILISAHDKVVNSGKYNFEGCKIPVNENMNFSFMRHMLASYNDKIVCEFLEFGFPLGCIKEPCQNTSKSFRNHKGAREFPVEINKYFVKEMEHKTVLGPFKHNPFKKSAMILSPLNSVPKNNTEERRIILDLSFPKGNSVNDSIVKDIYLGDKVSLIYPKVDDFVELIKVKGQGCHLFKKDLRRGYRQVFIDPGEYHKVGYRYKGHLFFDTVLSMGLRSSAHIFQRVTNAVAFIMLMMSIYVLNYLDDLVSAEKAELSLFSYMTLEGTLEKCGFRESKEKACAPSTRMAFIGVYFDTEKMTLEITPERLIEIRNLVQTWLKKSEATKKQVQSLIGKLSFISSCVRPGRVFVQRLLKFLREIYKAPDTVNHILPDYVRKDLLWWHKFLPYYNGISMMSLSDWSAPDSIISTDACLTGCGGFFGNKYFHVVFPELVDGQKWHINALELLAIVIALKLWGSQLNGKKVIMLCDNLSSCTVINKGSTRCDFLQSCLREICFLAALHEFEIRAKHISGVDNRVADYLSRWHLDSANAEKFLNEFGNKGEECEVSLEDFHLTEYW
ncbi:MAG: hypothetical protein ABW168_07960 [Sedimenticola sp.]